MGGNRRRRHRGGGAQAAGRLASARAARSAPRVEHLNRKPRRRARRPLRPPGLPPHRPCRPPRDRVGRAGAAARPWGGRSVFIGHHTRRAAASGVPRPRTTTPATELPPHDPPASERCYVSGFPRYDSIGPGGPRAKTVMALGTPEPKRRQAMPPLKLTVLRLRCAFFPRKNYFRVIWPHLLRGSSAGSRYSRLIGPNAVTWVMYSPDFAQWKCGVPPGRAMTAPGGYARSCPSSKRSPTPM